MEYEGLYRDRESGKFTNHVVDTSDDVEAIRLLQAHGAVKRTVLFWATVVESNPGQKRRVLFTG